MISIKTFAIELKIVETAKLSPSKDFALYGIYSTNILTVDILLNSMDNPRKWQVERWPVCYTT